MRSASPAQHPQCGAHRFPQLCNLVDVQRTSSACWVQTRSPQCFIGEQVAEPGDASLIHEPSLQRRVRVGQDRFELRKGNFACIGAKSLFIRIELHTAEPSWVAQSQCATTFKVHHESFPCRIFAMTRILKTFDRINTIEFQYAGHPEAQTKRWSVLACVKQQ
jgi:hypothetical protein